VCSLTGRGGGGVTNLDDSKNHGLICLFLSHAIHPPGLNRVKAKNTPPFPLPLTLGVVPAVCKVWDRSNDHFIAGIGLNSLLLWGGRVEHKRRKPTPLVFASQRFIPYNKIFYHWQYQVKLGRELQLRWFLATWLESDLFMTHFFLMQFFFMSDSPTWYHCFKRSDTV
jgi:hypothetical protein